MCVQLNGGYNMLVDFRVRNCLSYKEETLFSMVAGKRIRKLKDTHTIKIESLRLVKSAFVFGPNGSGKSNLFSAIKVLRSLLFNFENLNSVKKLRLPYQPFKLGGECGLPIEFVISLMLDGSLYDYEIHYNADQVLYERLTKIEEIQEEKLFLRKWDARLQDYIYEAAQIGHQELTKYTRNNTAFLSVLNVFNDRDAAKIYEWFTHKVLFLDEAHRLSSHPLIRKLEEESFKHDVIKLLKIADFSIQDVTARRVERRENNISSYEFDGGDTVIQEVDIDLHYLSFDDEGTPLGTETINWTMDSKGTVRMLHLACVMVDAHNKGKTLFIDEFDTAFHVSICEFLMAIMNSRRNETNQFIVTSHEIDLLDQPLRSDQIWFVNKNFKNESELYSLFDFAELQNKRGDISYAKRYLKGEFGATPVINEYLSSEYLGEAEVQEQ